jgi:FixJ family two-component response regulator
MVLLFMLWMMMSRSEWRWVICLIRLHSNIAAFDSAQAFLEVPHPTIPCCMVLDIRMPGMSGLELQRQMKVRDIDVPVIFISAHGDIPMSVAAMKEGAVDFLVKPFREQELLDTIQRALEISRQKLQSRAKLDLLQHRYQSLSSGEKSVMHGVVNGLLNKQIAHQLNVSEITVKVRRSQVMKKMQADSVAELVLMADRLRMIVEE